MMCSQTNHKNFAGNNPNRQSGFGAFAYILLSISLLAAITAALSMMTRGSNTAQQNDIMVSNIYGQASKIRSDILLCMTESNETGSGVGPDSYRRFPACDGNPNQTGTQAGGGYGAANYCAITSTLIEANASQLTCLSQGSLSVWDNSEGNFFPDAIGGFEPWKYSIQSSGLKGVYLSITTKDRSSNANIDWVLKKVRDRFGPNEAEVTKRTADGMTSDKFASCASDCNTLRIWLAK